jgi:hypothetical protein
MLRDTEQTCHRETVRQHETYLVKAGISRFESNVFAGESQVAPITWDEVNSNGVKNLAGEIAEGSCSHDGYSSYCLLSSSHLRIVESERRKADILSTSHPNMPRFAGCMSKLLYRISILDLEGIQDSSNDASPPPTPDTRGTSPCPPLRYPAQNATYRNRQSSSRQQPIPECHRRACVFIKLQHHAHYDRRSGRQSSTRDTRGG